LKIIYLLVIYDADQGLSGAVKETIVKGAQHAQICDSPHDLFFDLIGNPLLGGDQQISQQLETSFENKILSELLGHMI